MIILSFDIGIKNLAYCMIESESKCILDWNILDCSGENETLRVRKSKITSVLSEDDWLYLIKLNAELFLVIFKSLNLVTSCTDIENNTSHSSPLSFETNI